MSRENIEEFKMDGDYLVPVKPVTEEEKIEDIKKRATTELKMAKVYGGDNLPTKVAIADALTKIKLCEYIQRKGR